MSKVLGEPAVPQQPGEAVLEIDYERLEADALVSRLAYGVYDANLKQGVSLIVNGQRGVDNLAPEYIQRAVVAVGANLAAWPNPWPPNSGNNSTGPVRFLGEVPNNTIIGGPPETLQFQSDPNNDRSIRIIPYCEYGGHRHASRYRVFSQTGIGNSRVVVLKVDDAFNDQNFEDYTITVTFGG